MVVQYADLRGGLYLDLHRLYNHRNLDILQSWLEKSRCQYFREKLAKYPNESCHLDRDANPKLKREKIPIYILLILAHLHKHQYKEALQDHYKPNSRNLLWCKSLNLLLVREKGTTLPHSAPKNSREPNGTGFPP